MSKRKAWKTKIQGERATRVIVDDPDSYEQAEELLAGMTGRSSILPAVCMIPDCGCSGLAHA